MRELVSIEGSSSTLKLDAPLHQFGDNAIKVGGRTGQAVKLRDHEVSPSRKYSRQAFSAGRPASTPERFSLKTLSQPVSFSSCTVKSLAQTAYPCITDHSHSLSSFTKTTREQQFEHDFGTQQVLVPSCIHYETRKGGQGLAATVTCSIYVQAFWRSRVASMLVRLSALAFWSRSFW